MILRRLQLFSHGLSGVKTLAVRSSDSISYRLEFSISVCLPLSLPHSFPPCLPPLSPLSLSHSLPMEVLYY